MILKRAYLRWTWLPVFLSGGLLVLWLNSSTAISSNEAAPTPGRGSIIGLITAAQTGERLVGVAVSVDGQTTQTNDDGVYRFDNVTDGRQVVTASFPGYLPTQKSRVVVNGELVWNSMAMPPAPEPGASATPVATVSPVPTHTPISAIAPSPTLTNTATPSPSATATRQPGSLVGVITNAETGERLAGAQVSAVGQTVQANGNGVYFFAQLPPGQHPVTAEYPGFHPATQIGFVVSTQTWWNSIALTPIESSTPTPASTHTPNPTSTSTPLSTATSLPPTPTHTPVTLPSLTPTQTPTVFPSLTATASPSPTPTQTPSPLPQAGSLVGLITDAETGERLAGVTVSVAGESMITAERGVYQFEGVPIGVQVVTAQKEGYHPEQKSREVIADQIRWNSITLTRLQASCPIDSLATFDLIPIAESPGDRRPDYLHGDLNLAQRGYSSTTAANNLVDYAGNTDVNAPQLAGLFEPNDFPGVTSVYRANHWNWGCGEHGCRDGVITDWPVTVMGLATVPGQGIFIPERDPQIYGGAYKTLVLYAEERRITLGYTRDDTVANGYAVHIENVCVDPNLLILYRAQIDGAGFRTTGLLPALRENEKLGIAFGDEIQVAIRDRGAFFDPRSRKDWWRGY